MSRHSLTAASGDRVALFPGPVPDAAFAAAAVQLYSRLWGDLECLGELCAEGQYCSGQPGLERCVLMLRLELTLLLESCQSGSWSALLPGSQLDSLRVTLEPVALMVGHATDALQPHMIARAQNRLLDEVLRLLR